jgi:hypothetical protein
MRGLHPVHVFVHARKKDADPRPATKINNMAWKAARERAADEWQQRHGESAPEGFRRVRVHDLKHYISFLTISCVFTWRWKQSQLVSAWQT